jgi:hypothetical protein
VGQGSGVFRSYPVLSGMPVPSSFPSLPDVGHPGQHLPAGEPPRPLLDRPDALIQRHDQAQPAAQLGHRDHPAHGRQRRVGRPDLDLPRVLPAIPAASTISVTLLLG